MAKACLAIGVGVTNGLAPLPGAVNGARNMATWASAAGYQTELVVDQGSDGKPTLVTVDRIKTALMRLLPPANDGVDRGGPAEPPERLIVYFAGHGMLSMAGDDLWLLSDSYSDQLAIGITQLQEMLRTYLPGKIAIISDACRSPAIANWNVRLTPMAVVPRGPYDPNDHSQIDIDRFLAVAPLTSAYMLRAAADQPARCIFTAVLLEALHGLDQHAFDLDRTDEITSQSIARYLRRHVKKRGSDYQVEMHPQSYPCWFDPDTYITRAELAAMALPPLDEWPAIARPGAQGPAPLDSASIFKSIGVPDGLVRGGLGVATAHAHAATMPQMDPFDGWLTDHEREQFAKEKDALAEQAASLTKRQERIEVALARSGRSTHYETECGFSATGAELPDPRTGAGVMIRPDASFAGSWQIDFGRPHPIGCSTPLVARTDTGDVLATIALGGYITDCVLEQAGCVVATFRPMWLDPSVRLLSETILASGSYVGASTDDALAWAARLRADDPFDPMLGILAAYCFHGAGETCSVRRLAALYAARDLPLPIDIALLASAPLTLGQDGLLRCHVPKVTKRTPRTREQCNFAQELDAGAALDIAVAGAYPIMRQGWFLLETAASGRVPSDLARLVPHLRAALFATFDADVPHDIVDRLLETQSWLS